MLVAISGGAGFLGLHLARRLIGDGHEVRILDPVPLDDPGLEGQVEELQGDVRLAADVRRLRVTARPVPARPAELALRGLELARLSPLAEWHYRTAHKDSFVSIDKARTLLGWEPRLSNAETLCATYDWYLAHRDELGAAGTTHRVPWDQRALGVLRRLS